MKKVLPFILAAALITSVPSVCAEDAETVGELAESASDETEKPKVNLPDYTKGDANNDGKLSETDFLRYKYHLIGYEGLISKSKQTDLNNDDHIDIHDMIKIRKVLDGCDFFWSLDNIPVMDGSTSAIPLETGFKSRMLDIPYHEAEKLVDHHKTHEAFDMLLAGKTDLIFTVPISEEQKQKAEDAGVKLNMIPVAREAFVFIVNKNNPVETLTSEQIRDIYSGQITNWKEVGGNDEPIIPYQRNKDSGSQNLVVEFMGDRKMIPPTINNAPIVSMGGLLEGIIEYDNSEQAIGYSVYSYAAQMYENSSDLKFIAVDGVKPSKNSILDKTYPLISYTYALYTDNAPDNTERFISWATSDEGQLCALENGYIPVNDIDIPNRLKPFTERGTGKEKDQDYKPDYYMSYLKRNMKTDKLVDFLKDKKVQDIINKDIKETINKNKLTKSFHDNVSMYYTLINGYMSVNILVSDGKDRDYTYSETALTYDIRDGSKIERFTDLFYKNSVFFTRLNDNLDNEIKDCYYNECYYDLVKTEFTGLTGSIDNFSITSILLPEDNPYLDHSVWLDFWQPFYGNEYLLDYMVIGKFYDMTEILDFSVLDINPDDINSCFREEWYSKRSKDENGKAITKVAETPFHNEEETKEYIEIKKRIEDQVNAIENKTLSFSKIKRDYHNSVLDVLTSGYACKYKYMFDSKGNRLYFSDIFGSEFSDIDNLLLNIKSISLTASQVEIEIIEGTNQNTSERIIDFDPKHVNMDLIIKGKEKATLSKLEKQLPIIVRKSQSGDSLIKAYSSDYILDYKKAEVTAELETGTKLVAKNKVRSHNKSWYECWDAQGKEYCGWINDWEVSTYTP